MKSLLRLSAVFLALSSVENSGCYKDTQIPHSTSAEQSLRKENDSLLRKLNKKEEDYSTLKSDYQKVQETYQKILREKKILEADVPSIEKLKKRISELETEVVNVQLEKQIVEREKLYAQNQRAEAEAKLEADYPVEEVIRLEKRALSAEQSANLWRRKYLSLKENIPED